MKTCFSCVHSYWDGEDKHLMCPVKDKWVMLTENPCEEFSRYGICCDCC